jgi:ATP-binding cassette subfamily C (CFTR/MRP) protein 1
VIKLQAWEHSFKKKVSTVRDKEVKLLKSSAYYDAVNSFIWAFAPILVSLVSFATFVLSDENNTLDAETAFVSLTLFNMMRYSLTMLPVMITSLVQVSHFIDSCVVCDKNTENLITSISVNLKEHTGNFEILYAT